MKNLNRYINMIAGVGLKFSLACILLLNLSCTDLLEEDPLSLATGDSYYSTAEGIQDGLKACYPPLRSYYGPERSFYLTVIGTDINTNGFGGNKNNPSFGKYDQNLLGTHAFLRVIWDNFYEGINQCNTIIGRAEEVPDLSTAEMNAAIAEARFLRAHYYFILVQQWGDVHFSLEETKGVETEAYRTPTSTIYQEGIIPDLEFAIANLPGPDAVPFGRANKGMAEALLARVQLTLSNWGEANRHANNVINNYNYALEDLDKLWDINNQENSEVIWSVQYGTDPLLNGSGSQQHNFFVWDYTRNPAMDRDIENGKPHQRFMPTNYYLDMWDPDVDARFHASFKTVWISNRTGGTINGHTVNPGDTAIRIVLHPVDDEIQKNAPYWYIDYNGEDVTTQEDKLQIGGDSRRLWPSFYKKYYDSTRPDKNNNNGSRDVIVIRLAEMYLIAAEAAIEMGNLEEAAQLVSTLRERATVPGKEAEMAVAATDMTFDFIFEERAKELGGEGHRWYDLKRRGILLERVRMYNPDGAPNIQEMHRVRPIPQTQIDRVSNPGDFPQNPGY